MSPLPQYAELHCISNFTFLRGASHPQELVDRASNLGYRALAITDECSVAAVVRAHTAAKLLQLKLLIGAEFRLQCGLKFVAIAIDRHGYGRLCRLISRGRRAAVKGSYRLSREDVETAGLEHCHILWVPAAQPLEDEARWLQGCFGTKVRIAVELFLDGHDQQQLALLQSLGRQLDLPLVAAGDVHMHVRERRMLQDALTAVRLNIPIAEAGWNLYPNGERHLRERARLARLYPPELLEETVTIAQSCTFSLDELRYQYPRELVPAGQTPTGHLRNLVEEGIREKWPAGISLKNRAHIDNELQLIADLRYEPYFLTVYDIVKYARKEKILCQGRGSAANSLVCYCLGISAVGPEREVTLLFERFVSRERNEPPDIDVDFEHDRREEVIQYIYKKYGRERAAIAATVIMYRPRSALRDMAKVFGMDPQGAGQLSKVMQWWDGVEALPERVRKAGFDTTDPLLLRIVTLARQLVEFPGFPRHLSQHVGGFVISEGVLEELVPVENATMPDRTVVQWDKDDLNDLGLLKVDVLALGMLSALRRAFALVNAFRGSNHTLGSPPEGDQEVYDMISRADTIGVFQIESRAQMSMLPRLRPRSYYDLVIEVAIVRPGPIQGDMIHPYLRRRNGLEPVDYPSESVREVLERTLGVPIFQEQVMQLAIVAAGFSPGEADQLRRAMGAWKRSGGIEHFKDKLLRGMAANGYNEEFAQRIYRQMLGFGEYGFPEAHAASFALLAYDSSWLKYHEPAAFTCALLNSQPMGFYKPAQLVRDARAHGVEVRPVDVQASGYESSLERREEDGEPALQLGLRMVKSLSEAGARRVEAARRERRFESVHDLGKRAALDRTDLEALAAAGALASLSGNRHLAYWEVAGIDRSLPLAPQGERTGSMDEGRPLLEAPTEGQQIVVDYASVGLTLGRHPLALLRPRLARNHVLAAEDLNRLDPGKWVKTIGIVLMRQRPQSARGVTFLTIEDETGQVNVIVWESVGEKQRRPMIDSRLLEVQGQLQRQEGVQHVIAQRLVDRSAWLGELLAPSRDFH